MRQPDNNSSGEEQDGRSSRSGNDRGSAAPGRARVLLSQTQQERRRAERTFILEG